MTNSENTSSYEPNFVLVNYLPVVSGKPETADTNSAKADTPSSRGWLDGLHKFLKRLAEPFEEQPQTDCNHEHDHTHNQETQSEPDPDTVTAIQSRITEEVLAGDTRQLMKLVNQFQRTKDPARLVYIFKGNLPLSRWVHDQADVELVLKLPQVIWELIDNQLK